jgi:hypothetical protein
MMLLLREDVGARWGTMNTSGIVDKYGVKLGEFKQQPWRMRDFTLHDPSGVLWYSAQNTD